MRYMHVLSSCANNPLNILPGRDPMEDTPDKADETAPARLALRSGMSDWWDASAAW